MQCFICLVLVLVLHNKLVMLFLARIESLELLVLFLSVALCFYTRRGIVPKTGLGQNSTLPFCYGGYFLLQYLLLLYVFHCYFGAIGIFQSHWKWMAVSYAICSLRSHWCILHLTSPKLFLLHKNTKISFVILKAAAVCLGFYFSKLKSISKLMKTI